MGVYVQPAVAFIVVGISVLSVIARGASSDGGESVRGDVRKSVRSDVRKGFSGKGEKVMMGYSDSWVVELDVGKEEADMLAERHGFVNLGQVRYYFVLPIHVLR